LYNVEYNWWENPLIAYAEAPLGHPDVVAQADADAIVGEGTSTNVDVRLTVVPHVDVGVRTMPRCDGIKGTITVSITTVDDFFDGNWTEMVRIKDKRISFGFNTCDPAKQLQQVLHVIRTIPAFSLERYTRGHEKWEPRSHWPDETEFGDARSVIYRKDAVFGCHRRPICTAVMSRRERRAGNWERNMARSTETGTSVCRDTGFLVSGCISVYLHAREPALVRRKTRMFGA
jgi:hypothetical protein